MAFIELPTANQGTTWVNTAHIVAINSLSAVECEIVIRNEQNYGVQVARSAKETAELINTAIRTIG